MSDLKGTVVAIVAKHRPNGYHARHSPSMVMLYATVEMAQNYRKEIVATHLAGHRPNPLRSLRYAFYSNERENLIGVRKGKHGKPVRQQEAELEKEFAYLVGTEMGNDPDWVI